MLPQLSDMSLLCSTNNLVILDWLFKHYILHSWETVLLLFFLLLLQQQQTPGQAKWDFYLFKAPPIMSTSSASLTSKPTLENYLSKYSLSPNHVETMLLKENGDWVQWSSCKLRICSQKYTGQGDHNTSQFKLSKTKSVNWAISHKFTWKVWKIVPLFI